MDVGRRSPSRPRVPAVAAAVVTVTALAVLDASLGSKVVLGGLLAVGPCLAAAEGRPRAVAAVGGYALVLVSLLAWRPDRIFATLHHALYLAGIAAVTIVSVWIARRHHRLELVIDEADERTAALQRAVQFSDEAIISTTVDGTILAWNAGAERLYGYTAEEAIGLPAVAFTPADDIGSSQARMSRIVGADGVARYEARRVHRNGTILDVAVVASPIRDATGRVVGISAVIRDLTEAKRADALRLSIEQRSHQAERMASLGQLAGGVAHDFNNMLAVMMNYTAFAAARTLGDPVAQRDLAQVQLAIERAAGLTRQLLVFTREDRIQPRHLDVNAAIAEVQAMLERTIGEHIQLVAVPSSGPMTIFADPGQIQQVLVNLALNARDAMPDGGTLVIEASYAELDGDQPDLHPAPIGGSYARLLVSDTGTGMSREVAAHIFEPFFTTKERGQGTGLGLATVYGIVTESGGSVNVYSEREVGTTIRVYLPLVAASDEAAPSPVVLDVPHGRGETVLAVEDEPALRRVVARILTEGGYRVLAAGSGPEALGIAGEHPFDLLLTDVVMPEMSGHGLAAKLAATRPGMRVLYMSGYSDGLLGSARALDPAVHVIEKPFTADHLLRRVAAELAEGAATRAERPARG